MSIVEFAVAVKSQAVVNWSVFEYAEEDIKEPDKQRKFDLLIKFWVLSNHFLKTLNMLKVRFERFECKLQKKRDIKKAVIVWHMGGLVYGWKVSL